MCGDCQDCPFKDAPTDKLFYEIHITVENIELDNKFVSFCETHGIKAIKISNFNAENKMVGVDTMTSHKVPLGTDPFVEMKRLQALFADFKIIRSKIETVPWHPLATSKNANGYFEAHLKIDGDLNRSFGNAGLSKSQKFGDTSTTMLTLRETPHINAWGIVNDYKTFALLVEKYVERIDYHWQIKVVEKPIIEYALYDDNVEHDKNWIFQYD